MSGFDTTERLVGLAKKYNEGIAVSWVFDNDDDGFFWKVKTAWFSTSVSTEQALQDLANYIEEEFSFRAKQKPSED